MVDMDDPKNVEQLKKFAEQELTPDGHSKHGEPVTTDDAVQNAVDDADGHHDGDIANGPESDVQAALLVYRNSKMEALDKIELSWSAAKAIFTKGERHIDPEDWAQLAVVLGPEVIDLVKRIVALAK